MSHKFKSDFEKNTYRSLKSRDIKVEYEPDKLSYHVVRNYIPDFKIKWLRQGVYQTTYIETKGYFSSADRTKMRLVKEQYPDLDIRMVFLSDNKINKNSKTRYSDWCEQHKFPYTFITIPKHWFK